MTTVLPRVSVLMPTFEQPAFLRRALESLLAQTLTTWELLIVDDGSEDQTEAAVRPYLADPRIDYHGLPSNGGLGAALNVAMARASAPFIAYLPSDDLFDADHLASLIACLDCHPDATLAFSGIRYEYRVPGKGVLSDETSSGQIEGRPLQLAQVMHRATDARWMERDELVTDDLDRMFWMKLRKAGGFVGTGRVSCEWVDHPLQRHKIVQEPLGGINPYRSRYRVRNPLKFHTSRGNFIDEVEHYKRFRERPDTPPAADGLKILLVGELAFNPERVLALEERGHQLYGLWTPDGHWFNTVGPMPFGHVTDLPRADWRRAVRQLKPDIMYALLNWEAVPFAHQVLSESADVPFVWHLKEGPFDCIANGTWPLLLDLHTRSDGQIYSSPEMRDWFCTIDPRGVGTGRSFVLDGDLPKGDWFTADRSPRVGESDGQIHTVVPGGPIGITPQLVSDLATRGIHLHFYGDFHRGVFGSWSDEVRRAAPEHFHVHPQVNQDQWVSELSAYDAGWLHLLRSRNEGDLRRATWADLNYPARIPTLLSAGLPLIQYAQDGAVVATESLARQRDIGLFFSAADDLAEQLRDTETMGRLRNNAWLQRNQFTFDEHADRLVQFFREIINGRRS